MRLFSFTLILVGLLLMACDKKVAPPPLGPQTSEEAIRAAQIKSLQKLDPLQIKPGQAVHHIQTQEVVTSQGPVKQLNREWFTSVSKVDPQTDGLAVTTITQINDKSDKDFTYEFKDVFGYYYPEQIKNKKEFNHKALVHDFKTQATEAGVQQKQIKGYAFHNLKVREVKMVPPEPIKSQKNCKGLPKCRIPADLITYDLVFLMEDDSQEKYNFEWYLSAQVPFFASLFKQCTTALVPVENLSVLVKQCNEVVDFDWQ